MLTKLKENLASIAISLIIILIVLSYFFPDKAKEQLDAAKNNLNSVIELIKGNKDEDDAGSGIIPIDDVPIIPINGVHERKNTGDDQQNGPGTDEIITDVDNPG